MQVLEIQPRNNEEKKIVTESKIDPSFRKLTKNSVCFQIWKVDQDRIEAIPKAQYGIFYDDSTYILFAATPLGGHINQETIPRELKSPTKMERYIHFWLGKNTTPQKSGNVAYKVMELDSHFNNKASLYRETQDNESSRFLSYFKNGITILCGALSQTKTPCRLYQLQGKICLTCTEQPAVSWEHFSSGFVMILISMKYVFVWIGRSSSCTERINALKLAKKLQEDQNVPELSIVDDGYEQSMNDERKMEWNQFLSLKNRFVHQPRYQNGQPLKSPLKLYKCGYVAGKYRIEEVKTSPPEQEDLNDSAAVYVIDGISLGVWVWVGRLASTHEKVEAMRNARGFVKKKKYPSSTPVVRVVENHEPVEFTRLFSTWQFSDVNSNKFVKLTGKLDSLTLLQRPKMAAETQLIDDGSGEKSIFCITEGKFVELPRQKHTPFFSTECYILHYCISHTDNNLMNNNDSGIRHILYFWCGTDALPDSQNKADILANNYFENLGKQSMMIKLNEGLETPHFLQIFNGKFMTFKDYVTGIPEIFVLKVYGDSTKAKAVQIQSPIVFHSRSCLVIKSFSTWVWCGQSTTGDAREVAKSVASLLGEYTLIVESKEPQDFWQSISQDMEYQNMRMSNSESSSLSSFEEALNSIDKIRASLYMGYREKETIILKEILGFEQKNLNPEDIYLLDSGNLIFVWIGKHCKNDEREILWNMVKQYLRDYPVLRNKGTAIALVKQQHEPNIFIGFFDNWDTKLWRGHITYESLRIGFENLQTSTPILSGIYTTNGESDFDKHQKFPITVLQQEVDMLPDGVNPTKKEIHLTHDDFVSVFEMKYDEFESLPAWKKQELKKRHKLF